MSLLDALGGSGSGVGALGGSGAGALGGTPSLRECSRAGCRAEAVWSIGWRNPKIHAADRVKVWVACDEHVDFLREFLVARDFPLAVTTLDVAPDAAPHDPAANIRSGGQP